MKIDLRAGAIAAFALFIVSLVYLSHVYACLTLAFVLAYFLEPVVGSFERKGVPRAVSAPATLVFFFTGVTLVAMGIVPRIVEQGHELVMRLPAVYLGVTSALQPSAEQYLGYNPFHDVDKLVQSISDPSTLVEPLGGLVTGVFAHTFSLITTVLGLLIIPLMAYYVLRDFPRFEEKLYYLAPVRHHAFLRDLVTRLDGVLGGFIRGQLVVSSILALYYSAALAALGLKLALVLGLMAGFFNVVPYLGILSVLTLTVLIAFINGAEATTFVGIAIVFAVGMGAEGSLLTPRIVGRKVGLSPLTLILALLVGGELLGLVGMLLAVPLAAVTKVFVSLAVERYRRSEVFQKT